MEPGTIRATHSHGCREPGSAGAPGLEAKEPKAETRREGCGGTDTRVLSPRESRMHAERAFVHSHIQRSLQSTPGMAGLVCAGKNSELNGLLSHGVHNIVC